MDINTFDENQLVTLPANLYPNIRWQLNKNIKTILYSIIKKQINNIDIFSLEHSMNNYNDNGYNINNVANSNSDNGYNINNNVASSNNNDININNEKYKAEHYSCQLQGRRQYMEDAHIIFCINDWNVYAVFDGHGGDSISEWLRENISKMLWPILSIETSPNVMMNMLKKTIIRMDKNLFYTNKKPSGTFTGLEEGSTLIVLLFNTIKKHAYTINIGDSSACIFKSDAIVFCTKDHKPNDPIEKNRILQSNHKVYFDGWGSARIDGSLAVSRAIGDFYFKIDNNDDYMGIYSAVSPEPDIQFIDLSAESGNVYAYVCSDGVTDGLPHANIVKEANIALEKETLKNVCEIIMNKAYILSMDNMTLILIKLL